MSEHPVTTRPARGSRPVWTVVAVLAALLALALAAWAAHLLRQQARATVWPHVEIQSSERNRNLLVVNKGVGPALIEHVSVRAYERALRTWPDVLRELALAPVNIDTDYRASVLSGRVLSPGESHVFLQSIQAGQFEILNAAIAEGRVTISLCYCSSLGDCWLAGHDPERGGARPRQVRSCPGEHDAFAE